MAKVIEYKEIPIDKLNIGKGQVRTQDVGAEIEELAESIRVQGLLQPIVVCDAKSQGEWEILTGQRRFLAHKKLGKKSITAAVLDERVDEIEAKSISITENLIRRKLTGKELIDGITFLYNHYASASDVAKATGIPYQSVLDHVKYPRLRTELKTMVDSGDVDLKTALRAQDSASGLGKNERDDEEIAVRLVKEMNPMSGVQQTKLAKILKNREVKDVDDAIESAKTGAQVFQIKATVTSDTRDAINQVARAENTNQDEATVTLIEEALASRGILR